MNNMIELKNIYKNYFSSKKIEVLKNINFIFKPGKIYSLIGPSGSGKSTLLNLISLIDKPSSGFIKLYNVKINDNDEDKWKQTQSLNVFMLLKNHDMTKYNTNTPLMMVVIRQANR